MFSWYRDDQGYTTHLNEYVSISLMKAEVYFFSHSSNIVISVCAWRYIFFHFLIYFSVYKFGSQTKPSLDLEANDPSKARLQKFKGLLMMPDK